MRLLAKYIDDQYPKTKITHTRLTVRAFVINDDKKVALQHLYCDDIFGHRDYYETPGGGVKDNESLIEALKRELKEELGARVDCIEEIGRVIDYYNLIQQRNDIYYYFCHVVEMSEPKYDIEESKYLDKTVWVDVEEAIKIYENMDKYPLEKLVSRRELPIALNVMKRL